MGAGMLTGIMTIPGQMQIKDQKKKAAKLQKKHQALLWAQEREKLKDLTFNSERTNKRENQAIEESMSERGLGSSSIENDAQADREYEFGRRKKALEMSRLALESGIFTSSKMQDISEKIAKIQNTINVINSLSGGAAGAVEYYSSPQSTNVG